MLSMKMLGEKRDGTAPGWRIAKKHPEKLQGFCGFYLAHA